MERVIGLLLHYRLKQLAKEKEINNKKQEQEKKKQTKKPTPKKTTKVEKE